MILLRVYGGPNDLNLCQTFLACLYLFFVLEHRTDQDAKEQERGETPTAEPKGKIDGDGKTRDGDTN